MNRRGFLGSILALGAAPAIVRADSLMRIIPTDTSLLYDIVIDVGPSFTSARLALSIDEFSRRYIDPAMARLVAEIEQDVLANIARHQGDKLTIRMPNQYTRR